VVFYFLWNFNIFNNTLSCVVTEICRVQINCDRMDCCLNNFCVINAIYFSHSFHFSKLNIISFLIWMSFIFMHCNISFISFFNHSYNELSCCFSIMVSDGMMISIVEECITPWAEPLSWNVSNIFFSAKFVINIWVQIFSS
jgi:hypothetical protein